MTAELIEDSRLSGGTLTIDAVAFAKQMTSVGLTPTTSTNGDAVETLSGATIDPDEVTAWTLDVGAIQDFDDPAGFVEFARANAGQLVPFSWKPNAAGAPTYAGTVRVRAVAIGGQVATRLTNTTSWPVIGDYTTTYTP